MSNWFECKVRYDKMTDKGIPKKVTESYLIDALSFTEAEARIIKEITPYMSGEFTVSAVKKTTIAEIFFSDQPDDDKWYAVKAAFITIDEVKAIEKKKNVLYTVQACDFETALKNFVEGMGQGFDYDIVSITETPIMEVYKEDLSAVVKKEQN